MCKYEIADTFFKRFKGLMLRKEIKNDGLLLMNCSSIHTCFMRFEIEAIYLDENYKVIYIEKIKPWRIGKIVHNTKHILERKINKDKKYMLGENVIDEIGGSNDRGKK